MGRSELVKPVEYVFTIDAFTPDTLPMGRLAEYLTALAKLIGCRDQTHFVAVEKGSANLVHRVESVDAPKVETRIAKVRSGDGATDAVHAWRALDDLLANDNAIGDLIERKTGKVVLSFQGRNRPKLLVFPAFREAATIQGQIVSIGGRDATAHAILQDGDLNHTNINMSREIARSLAPLLYGPHVRLYGNGRFERGQDGKWRMLDFRVDSFQKLVDQPLDDTLRELRPLQGNDLMQGEAYWDSRDFHNEGEEDQG
jgi:hypothetical protein